MAKKFLDETGVGTLWSKIKSVFATKTEVKNDHYTKLEVDRIQQGNVNALNNKISHAQLAELTRLKSNVDNRNVNTKPNDYNGWFDIKGLKNNTAINIPSGNTDYSAVLGLRGWLESSGGNAHELAFTGNGNIYHRYGATTSWNEWEKLATNKELDGKLGKTETAVKAQGLVDIGDGRIITARYSNNGNPNPSYYAVWSDETITYASKEEVKNNLGINNLATKSELTNLNEGVNELGLEVQEQGSAITSLQNNKAEKSELSTVHEQVRTNTSEIQQRIMKAELSFSLSGSTLTITKRY